MSQQRTTRSRHASRWCSDRFDYHNRPTTMHIPSDLQTRQSQGIPPYFWPEYSGPLRLPPLPSLEDIARAREAIPQQRWRFAYGLMAVYGLRPGELTALRSTRDGQLLVRGKAGDRRVAPSPLKWVEAWELDDLAQLPRLKPTPGTTVAGIVAAKFRRDYSLPFELRCLRLAYYQRVLAEGSMHYTERAS